MEDLLIIGSGPAGLTAAIYASRENLNVLVVEGPSPGGQLLLTSEVENFPGFPDGILGADLIDNMRKQAERFGAKFVADYVVDLDFSSKPFKAKLSSSIIEARSIIIATGATAKWLGIPSEQKFIGKGVSSCAVCDAAFFKGKNVIVVGGGDTAMEDSNYLTRFANSVILVHRRDTFRATAIMQQKVLSNPKIKVIYNSVVEEIFGEDKVTGVQIRNLKSNETTELNVDGVFVAIGNDPITKFLQGKLSLDDHGYIITHDEVKTSIEGVFAAGDVADKRYKQAITASASGAKAAIEASDFLQSLQS
ncbi:MAG: thioredoxin-disulfide reductase [Candidatus Micrarchaeaceae archaeon]